MTSNQDSISWGQKAKVLFRFAAAASNMVRETDDEMVKVGAMMGAPMLLSFAIECVLKELLTQEGRSKRGHKIHDLFCDLNPDTRRKVVNVYSAIIEKETDPRTKKTPINDLEDCLKHHNDMFTDWRYNTDRAGSYYHVALHYACASLLSLAYPESAITLGGLTLPMTTIKNGQIDDSRNH